MFFGVEGLVQTTDSGYCILTNAFAPTATWEPESVALLKIDANGNAQWNQTIPIEGLGSLVQTNDGGYAMAGSNDTHVWIVKTDPDGILQWNATYEKPSSATHALSIFETGDRQFTLIETQDNGFALAGPTAYDEVKGYDFLFIKTDGAGNELWNKTYGGAGNEALTSLIETSDGGYVLAGYTYSFGNGGPLLIGTDSSGNVIWTRIYETNWRINSIVQGKDAGLLLIGSVNSAGGGEGFVLIAKTDLSGNTLWNETYGGRNYGFGYNIDCAIETTNGNLVHFRVMGGRSKQSRLLLVENKAG